MKDEHTHAATTSKEQAAESGSGSTGSPRPHVISRRVFSTRSAWTLALLLAATVFYYRPGDQIFSGNPHGDRGAYPRY